MIFFFFFFFIKNLIDSLTISSLDVGEFNINSINGISISTETDISFDGASITSHNADRVTFTTINDDSSISIVAATTLDLLGSAIELG